MSQTLFRPYLYQFSIDSHSLKGIQDLSRRSFKWCPECPDTISIHWAIRQSVDKTIVNHQYLRNCHDWHFTSWSTNSTLHSAQINPKNDPEEICIQGDRRFSMFAHDISLITYR